MAGTSPPAPTTAMIDVVAPPPVETTDDPATEIDPVDKLAAEDKASQQAAAKKPDKKSSTKPPKPKKTSSGVGMAIAATVLIVFGLAGLATYAYLQTAK